MFVAERPGYTESMAKVKTKKVHSAGKRATVIALLSNPVIRRAVFKGANKAILAGSSYMATRSARNSPTPAPSVDGQTTVVPQTQAKSSIAEAAAVETIVGSVATAAKPLAEKLAASDAGRSVLQAVNSISGQALGSPGQQRRGGAAMAGFVTNILGGQTATPKPEVKSPGSDVKFVAARPAPATAATPPVKTMQWPPQKDSEASNG